MHTLQITREKGHLLVEIGGRRALVATGAPFSLAETPFELLGRQHHPPVALGGWTPRRMSELAGVPFDIVIGCDILAAHTIRIRWNEEAFDVGEDVPEGPIASAMDSRMGTPMLALKIDGRPTRALLDTGAHLSYVAPSVVHGKDPVGERSDFHPVCGHYSVPTFIITVDLDGRPVPILAGIPPEGLRTLTEMELTALRASAVLGTSLFDVFDCTISWPRERISWRRAATDD